MALKVLIVDDDFINRKLLLALLKKHPEIVSETVEAENGAEALKVFREEGGADLVLLDIMMPVLDGRKFLEIFRDEEANRKIPVIVLSTDDTQKSIVENLGADAFIIKPVAEPKLIETILRVID